MINRQLTISTHMLTKSDLPCVYPHTLDDNYNKMDFKVRQQLLSFIKKVSKSEWYYKNYDNINIEFWGGEPTLKIKAINHVINAFADFDKVSFTLYTNLNNIQVVQEIIEILKDKKTRRDDIPKLKIIVLYAGEEINDLNNIDKWTTTNIKNNINWLINNDVNFQIQPFIKLNNMKYIIDLYDEVKQLLPNNKTSFYFNPVLDYFNYYNLSTDEVEQYKNDLTLSLEKILPSEIKEYRKTNNFFFKWFDREPVICDAGKNKFAVDIDGKILKCKGCFYATNRNEHIIGSVFDKDITDDLEESYNTHNTDYICDECSECSSYCVKCNVKTFECDSANLDYISRWNNFNKQEYLCDIYKLNEIIFNKLDKLLKFYS